MAAALFPQIGIVLTTIGTVWIFCQAIKSNRVLFGIILWMGITALLGLSGFYRQTDAWPPRFVFLLGPGILLVPVLAFSKGINKFMGHFDLKWLTMLHVVRVPVEIVLFYVYLDGLIPVLMTFHGYNFDILSGITAPFVYYFVFIKRSISKKLLLAWNVICLGLLINILSIAALSAQTPFQKLAFDQPNIGVTYFPFVWLPAIIVPIVLFSHLISIKNLIKSLRDEKLSGDLASKYQ